MQDAEPKRAWQIFYLTDPDRMTLIDRGELASLRRAVRVGGSWRSFVLGCCCGALFMVAWHWIATPG